MVKPLDLTAGQTKGVKDILQDIYGPAMSLAANAELTEKATKQMMDDMEARSQQAVVDQTAAMYLRTGQCANALECQKKATTDAQAIFDFQDLTSMSQADRIKWNADLAVGLYTGAVDKVKFRGIQNDAAWTVNTMKDCQKGAWLGKECNKLTDLIQGGAYKPGGKMDLANRTNDYLGKDSKALTAGAHNTAARHVNRAYANWCSKSGTGDSFGLQIDFNLDGGLMAGASVQFSVGIGIFAGRGGWSAGGFVAGGATFASGSKDGFVLGADAGVGVSGFQTNAGKAEDLNGWGRTLSLNTPLGGISRTDSGNVNIQTLGVGLSIGGSLTSYDTLTASGTFGRFNGSGCKYGG